MSVNDELSYDNFKRINTVNWLIAGPLAILFSWPYYAFCVLFGIDKTIILVGAIIFAFPFITTILHGHVTLAIGDVHRHLYYEWLEEHPYSWGFLFHSVIISTRFRLSLLAASMVIFLIGYFS